MIRNDIQLLIVFILIACAGSPVYADVVNEPTIQKHGKHQIEKREILKSIDQNRDEQKNKDIEISHGEKVHHQERNNELLQELELELTKDKPVDPEYEGLID